MAERKRASVQHALDWDVLCDANNPSEILKGEVERLRRELGGTIGGRATLVLRLEGEIYE